LDVVEKTDREQGWVEPELEDWAMAEEAKRSLNMFQPGCKGGDGNKACLKQQTYTKDQKRR